MKTLWLAVALVVLPVSCTKYSLERTYGRVEVQIVPDSSYIVHWKLNGVKILAVKKVREGYKVYFK